jgi:hypothetical protein
VVHRSFFRRGPFRVYFPLQFRIPVYTILIVRTFTPWACFGLFLAHEPTVIVFVAQRLEYRFDR